MALVERQQNQGFSYLSDMPEGSDLAKVLAVKRMN
jgi:hypothetical protein